MKPGQAKVLFASTLQRVKFADAADQIRVLDLPYIAPAPHSTWDEIRRVLQVLKAARSEKSLLLNTALGGLQPDTLAAAILGFLPKRRLPKIALFGCMWQPNTGLRGLLDRTVIKMADRSVDRYIVQSSEEFEVFPQLWGVDKSKLRRCLCCYSLTSEDLAAPVPGDHIFAGGDSFRDYSSFMEAARRLPQQKFFIASRRLRYPNLPANVTVRGVPHKEFMQLMRASKAVVTPLQKGLSRAAGQQTYLNAMYLRKAVIVSEAFAVKDHIRHGIDGLIVDGSVESYVDALTWILDPKNAEAVEKMIDAAYQTASERFSPKENAQNLVRLMEELCESRVR